MTQPIDIPSVGVVEFPDGMSGDEISAAIKRNYPHLSQPKATNSAVAVNAANKGIAGLPDMILNAPNNLLNLGRAAVGTVAGMAGRPDLMPDLVPNPDLARRGMEAVGAINPAIQPQGFVQKAIDYGTQGAVGGALTGGAGLARSAVGAGMGAMSGLAAGGTQEATGNPALAATAGMLPGGMAGARNLFSGTGKTAPLQSGNPIKDETFAKGQAEGYVVPPSAMKPTWMGNRIEGLAGKAALGQEASLRNQPITNKIAAREAGLAPNEPISISTLTAARDRLAAPYRAVEELPGLPAKQTGTWQDEFGVSKPIMGETPSTPKQLVHDWKSNNARITELWNDYKQNHKVETLDAYKAARTKQESIETNIEQAAIAAGRADLVPALRKARVELAKNFNVERALNLGDGNVDASVLGRMYDHGAKLTGGLESIAKFQQAFPSVTREASKVPAPGVSKLEGWGALTLGLAGHAMMPGGGLLAALPLAVSPGARQFALSPYMQGGRSYGPGILSQVAQQTSPVVTGGILADILRNQQSR